MSERTKGVWVVGNPDCDWSVETGYTHTYIHIGPVGRDPVAIVVVPAMFGMDELVEANAAFICRAVNAHDDLVAALALARNRLQSITVTMIAAGMPEQYEVREWAAEADAALAKARGE